MTKLKRQSNITPEMMLKARTHAGLNQNNAAKAIGKSVRTYKYYESGKICATEDDYIKLTAIADKI